MDFVAILLVLLFVLSAMRFPPEMAAVAHHLRIAGYIAALRQHSSGAVVFARQTAQTMQLLRLCLAFLPARWLDYLCAVLSTLPLACKRCKKATTCCRARAIALPVARGWSDVMLVLHAFDLHFRSMPSGSSWSSKPLGRSSPLVQVSSAHICCCHGWSGHLVHPPRTRPQCGAGHARVVLLSLHSGRPGLPVARKPHRSTICGRSKHQSVPLLSRATRHVGIDVALTAA